MIAVLLFAFIVISSFSPTRPLIRILKQTSKPKDCYYKWSPLGRFFMMRDFVPASRPLFSNEFIIEDQISDGKDSSDQRDRWWTCHICSWIRPFPENEDPVVTILAHKQLAKQLNEALEEDKSLNVQYDLESDDSACETDSDDERLFNAIVLRSPRRL